MFGNQRNAGLNYLPPFEAIKALVTSATVRGEPTITATHAQFTGLVRALLRTIDVDEAWYLKQYPDVAEAIRDGVIDSAKEHFLNDGYFEGRLPFLIEVDEAWYLEQYPEIADHVARGELESAQKHFNDIGYREGRRPFPA